MRRVHGASGRRHQGGGRLGHGPAHFARCPDRETSVGKSNVISWIFLDHRGICVVFLLVERTRPMLLSLGTVLGFASIGFLCWLRLF